MNAPLFEVREKPRVFVGGIRRSALIPPVLEGLEEEGIPWKVRHPDLYGLTDAAHDLARESRINVGLAISPEGAVLHHRDLPRERPLFVLETGELTPETLRRLGRNTARLVKGNPFIPEPECKG